MCEVFARQRLAKYPPDIAQRVANGLGSILSVLKNPCGSYFFPFQKLLSSDHPTANLPVLFSSALYRPPDVEALAVPRNNPAQQMLEYWYGLGPTGGDTFCSKSTAKSYLFEANAWKEPAIQLFKSVPGVCLYADGNTVKLRKGEQVTTLVNGAASALQLSGNGEKYFMKNVTGWRRYTGALWEQVMSGTVWELSPSFDGTCCILSDPRSRLVWCFIGTQSAKGVSLPVETSGQQNPVFAGVVDRLFFIARGRYVFTAGSLGKLEQNFELAVGTYATGLWVDKTTIWIATNKGTIMSYDAGWTWVEQKDKFAVGPGLYTMIGSNNLSQTADRAFTQSVDFPLYLKDSGLLYNSTWSTWFEDKTMGGESTEVEKGAPSTVSPNGLYLVTQEGGVLNLYLNVWNFPTFLAWCKLEKKECKPAYAKYCELYKDVDQEGCATDTPGRSAKGDGKGMSTINKVLIALGSLAGLVLLIGLINFLVQRSKRRAKVKSLTPTTLSSTSSTSSIASPTSPTSSQLRKSVV